MGQPFAPHSGYRQEQLKFFNYNKTLRAFDIYLKRFLDNLYQWFHKKPIYYWDVFKSSEYGFLGRDVDELM